MADLIALGKDDQQRLWQSIPERVVIVLGRAPRAGWSVPWDRLISREHAHLEVVDGKLHVSTMETARNPILVDDVATREFVVDLDGEFRIGETTFRFCASAEPESNDGTVVEHMLSRQLAMPERFDNASACLAALCQMPSLMASTRDDVDFATKIVDLLLDSLPEALAVAVLRFESDDDGSAAAEPALIRWNSRDGAVNRFRPSRRLMNRALERQQSVVHLWSDQQRERSIHFTMSDDLDWAFCTPIPTTSSERWCLYASGRRSFSGMQEIQSPEDLIAHLRLAELMAEFLGAVRQVRALEHQQSEMRQFFSPAVVETLASGDSIAALEPREGLISVLFCDVRGFSSKVEAAQGELRSLLDRVSEALSVMTRSILKYEGVIADFQGDAALGFWGWPTAVEDAPALACRTALLIQRTFSVAQRDPDHPLYGFHVGIGIGTGSAVAGLIGTEELSKVGVFGPVVNLASRLQDLTKSLQAPILIDEPTARALSPTIDGKSMHCRPAARFRLTGIPTPVEAFALGNASIVQPALTDGELATHRRAVEAFLAGDWGTAAERLSDLPLEDGLVALLDEVMRRHEYEPPARWDGVLNVDRTGNVHCSTHESDVQCENRAL